MFVRRTIIYRILLLKEIYFTSFQGWIIDFEMYSSTATFEQNIDFIFLQPPYANALHIIWGN